MNLVEAEATGPIEGDEPLVTPPRPLHRRVSVSLVFTLTVLTATVVAIYVTFPARNTVLMVEALERHRERAPVWDLTTPTQPELRAWAIGVVGKDPPLPRHGSVDGAREISVLGRRTALVQVTIDDERVTYVVQHSPVVAPEHSERTEGEGSEQLRAVAWRVGEFTCVAVGRAASASTWSTALAAR
jgi:hypothetical protein